MRDRYKYNYSCYSSIEITGLECGCRGAGGAGDFFLLWLQVEDGVSFLVPVLDIFDWTPVFKR